MFGDRVASLSVSYESVTLPLSEVEVLSPITQDRKFLCQAVSYDSHMADSAIENPDTRRLRFLFAREVLC